MTKFVGYSLKEIMATEVVDLKASLKEFFGFDSFKGMQEQVISTILE